MANFLKTNCVPNAARADPVAIVQTAPAPEIAALATVGLVIAVRAIVAAAKARAIKVGVKAPADKAHVVLAARDRMAVVRVAPTEPARAVRVVKVQAGAALPPCSRRSHAINCV